jgi:hypothetical protein
MGVVLEKNMLIFLFAAESIAVLWFNMPVGDQKCCTNASNS